MSCLAPDTDSPTLQQRSQTKTQMQTSTQLKQLRRAVSTTVVTCLLDIHRMQHDDHRHPLTGRDAARWTKLLGELLHLAASRKHAPVVELLLERGDAPVDAAKVKRDGRHSSPRFRRMMLV